MKERQIIFRTDMVQAILDGRKTQTRRVMKPQPDALYRLTDDKHSPFQIGQTLWVRETFYKPSNDLDKVVYKYKADANRSYLAGFKLAGAKWTPSIFMPRWASRITLEITGVRVEKLRDIKWRDVKAEGVDLTGMTSRGWNRDVDAGHRFANLWDSINAKNGFGWEVNPWVFVISFMKLD